MKKITFSHWYFKLTGIYVKDQKEKKARLLQILKIHYKDLSKYMIKYDAIYNVNDEYILPKTELILLLFNAVTYRGGLFTTIRRYTPSKWDYYKNSEGEIFQVVINE